MFWLHFYYFKNKSIHFVLRRVKEVAQFKVYSLLRMCQIFEQQTNNHLAQKQKLSNFINFQSYYSMKQQLLEKREILIEHLQSKIKALREQRNLMFKPDQQIQQVDSHININSYLAKQTSFPQKQIKFEPKNIKHSQLTKQNYFSTAPTSSKADIMRQQRETKQKIQKFGDLYNKKKQLESIGIQQDNAGKINHLFNNAQSKKQIEKKIQQAKANRIKQEEKDKVIEQELVNAKKFLKESKTNKINRNYIPEKHFTRVLASDQKKRSKITSLLNKNSLSLVEKDDILWQIFQVLQDKNNMDKVISKEALRQFLLSNIQICDIFYITKNEIMRDLEVYQTEQTNVLTYRQFYEFIKSVEITNLALKPNLKFKNRKEDPLSGKAMLVKRETDQKGQRNKQMENYLKRLYNYLDNKHQRVIQRSKLEIALKKALLFDVKKYKALTKKEVEQFGHKVERTRQKHKDHDYYKNLDIKYIGLEEILLLRKESASLKSVETQQHVQNIVEEENSRITEQAAQSEIQNTSEQQQKEMLKCELRPELSQLDFQRYGWQDKEVFDQKFKNIKELDRHYGQVRNKYGNQIAWNGIQHYRQDFSKFNECIKELNNKKGREAQK